MSKCLELINDEIQAGRPGALFSAHWQQVCEGALRRSEYVTSLMDGMLDLKKLENGTLSLSAQQLRLHDVVDCVFDMLSPLAKEGVEMRNTVDKSLCIPGDATRWQQVSGKRFRRAQF